MVIQVVTQEERKKEELRIAEEKRKEELQEVYQREEKERKKQEELQLAEEEKGKKKNTSSILIAVVVVIGITLAIVSSQGGETIVVKEDNNLQKIEETSSGKEVLAKTEEDNGEKVDIEADTNQEDSNLEKTEQTIDNQSEKIPIKALPIVGIQKKSKKKSQSEAEKPEIITARITKVPKKPANTLNKRVKANARKKLINRAKSYGLSSSDLNFETLKVSNVKCDKGKCKANASVKPK